MSSIQIVDTSIVRSCPNFQTSSGIEVAERGSSKKLAQDETFGSRTTLSLSPPAPAITPLIFAAASRSGSSARCAYFCVIAGVTWPSSFPMICKLNPPPAPTLAKPDLLKYVNNGGEWIGDSCQTGTATSQSIAAVPNTSRTRNGAGSRRMACMRHLHRMVRRVCPACSNSLTRYLVRANL